MEVKLEQLNENIPNTWKVSIITDNLEFNICKMMPYMLAHDVYIKTQKLVDYLNNKYQNNSKNLAGIFRRYKV